jgi:trk system potassium uptake protein
MFLIIAGGGSIGYHLLKHQLTELNEVILIEKDPARCKCITEDLGNLVILGDACDPAILEKAGIARADMVVATTGRDQDNLVICQIARKKYHIPHTLALANDPANLDLYKKLGVDAAVSAVDTILKRIELNIAIQENIATIAKEGNAQIVRANLYLDSPAVGKTLADLVLPERAVISAVIRDDEMQSLTPDFRMQSDDVIIAITPENSFEDLKNVLTGFELEEE